MFAAPGSAGTSGSAPVTVTRILLLAAAGVILSGCVSTVVGATAGAAIGVAGATAGVAAKGVGLTAKGAGKVVGAAIPDREPSAERGS